MAKISYTRQEDGRTCLISCDHHCVSTHAEEVRFLHGERAVIVYSDGKWTLYATSRNGGSKENIHYNGLYMFISDILDYKAIEDGFLFKKEDGWFFMFFSEALWYISNKEVRDERNNNFVKICDKDENISSFKICANFKCYYGANDEPNDYFYGFVIETTKKKQFIVYGGNMSVFGPCQDELIRIYGFKRLKESENMAQIYLTPEKEKFVIGSLVGEFGHHFSEECTDYKVLDDDCLLLKNGDENALFCIIDDLYLKELVPFGKYSIIKLPSVSSDIRIFVDGTEKTFSRFSL